MKSRLLKLTETNFSIHLTDVQFSFTGIEILIIHNLSNVRLGFKSLHIDFDYFLLIEENKYPYTEKISKSDCKIPMFYRLEQKLGAYLHQTSVIFFSATFKVC